MIDIYDELGYIKNVLSNGLSQKWERDAILLVRYYKMEGMKKSDAKMYIKQKCEEAARRPENPIAYNHLISYKRLNKIVDGAWKKEVPLRTIHEVAISKEVLDWFLNLENNSTLTDEEVAYYKNRRPGVSIKNNKAINWNRTKYLFTLYIWTKIQENYLDKPKIHYLKKYSKRFKEDANLNAGFSLQKERDYLFDLGYISVNYSMGIEPIFMEKNDVFDIPVTEENKIILLTGEPGEGDLYNCGYWLEKQKMGSFVCKNCGKEFAHYTNTKREKGRKYCKECAVLLKNHLTKKITIDGIIPPQGYRFCEECGEMYALTSDHDLKSKLCLDCRKEHKREQCRERVRRFRESKTNETNETNETE